VVLEHTLNITLDFEEDYHKTYDEQDDLASQKRIYLIAFEEKYSYKPVSFNFVTIQNSKFTLEVSVTCVIKFSEL
jgi:hypothetical protein